MSYQYEYALGTEHVEEPQVAVLTALGPGTPLPPPPPDPIFPIMPELPENVMNSVKDFTGSEKAGEVAGMFTISVFPVSFINWSNAFTWPVLIPWASALFMYGYRRRQGVEKDAALKSGATTLLGISLVGSALLQHVLSGLPSQF